MGYIEFDEFKVFAEEVLLAGGGAGAELPDGVPVVLFGSFWMVGVGDDEFLLLLFEEIDEVEVVLEVLEDVEEDEDVEAKLEEGSLVLSDVIELAFAA